MSVDEERSVAGTVSFSVPDISCGHCGAAIRREVLALACVETVEVDLRAKTVTATGSTLDEAAIVAAIDDAGYEVAG